MIRAALALYEATGRADYLERAVTWQRAFDAALRQSGQRRLFPHRRRRRRPGGAPASTSDDATPNPNGIAAQNLIRLAALTGDDARREQADKLIEGVLTQAQENLFSHASMLNALDLRSTPRRSSSPGPTTNAKGGQCMSLSLKKNQPALYIRPP